MGESNGCLEGDMPTASVRLRLLGWAARRLRLGSRAGAMSFGGTLSMLPDSSLVPLYRDGLDPVAQLGKLRDESPVSRLPLPLGIRAWLVTGYDAVRQVMADTRFSSRQDLGVLHVPYGTPGMPVPTENGRYTLVRDLPIDDFSREKMNATLKELEEERSGVASLLG